MTKNDFAGGAKGGEAWEPLDVCDLCIHTVHLLTCCGLGKWPDSCSLLRHGGCQGEVSEHHTGHYCVGHFVTVCQLTWENSVLSHCVSSWVSAPKALHPPNVRHFVIFVVVVLEVVSQADGEFCGRVLTFQILLPSLPRAGTTGLSHHILLSIVSGVFISMDLLLLADPKFFIWSPHYSEVVFYCLRGLAGTGGV